jgi:hypothetical protein
VTRHARASVNTFLLLLPRCLLSRAGEDLLRGKHVETAANGLLVVLPTEAGGVVDKGTLAEGISTACRLGHESGTGSLGTLLLLLLLLLRS